MVPLESINRIHSLPPSGLGFQHLIKINIPKVPWGVLKISGFAFDFQHFTSGPVMFIIIINKVPRYVLKTSGICLGFQIFLKDLGFVCLMLNVPINNFSVMLGLSHSFLCITSTLWGKYVLLKDTTRRHE